jgi:D-2-hydroxyacid dehydrogenase (NADP+)
MTSRLTAFVYTRNQACFLDIGPAVYAPLERACPGIRFEYLQSPDELQKRIAEPDIIITWRFPADLYRRATRLKAVFTPSAGKEAVEADPAGKVAAYYGSFHGALMAETLLAMILHFNCRFHLAQQNQSRHEWNRESHAGMRRLRQQHVLLVGYGAIGRHCATVLAPLGCTMAGVQRRHRDGEDAQMHVRYLVFDSMVPELAKADHVVLLLPGTTENRHIITRSHLKAMKPGAFLYNLGRGSVVAEEDLVWALESGTIAGAGLDVFDPEPLAPKSRLWDLKNVLILPHSSASYVDYGSLFVEELTGRLATLGFA